MLDRLLRRTPTPRTDADIERKLGLLRSADLFADLDDQQMGVVEQITVMTSCHKGTIIYRPDDEGESLFLLKQGVVHLYRLTPEGKRLLTAVIHPGTMFGNMAFTGSSLSGNYAEAQKESVLCVMSRTDIEDLVLRYPSIGLRLLRIQADRTRELEERLEEGLLRDMPARVASALLRLSDSQSSPRVSTTHQELADAIGAYRETVTHTLGQLQDEGAVVTERGHIVIVDRDRLAEILNSGRG